MSLFLHFSKLSSQTLIAASYFICIYNFTFSAVRQLLNCLCFNITVINSLAHTLGLLCCFLLSFCQDRCAVGDFGVKEENCPVVYDVSCHILPLAVFPKCMQVSVFHLKPTSFIFSGILRAVAMGIDLSVSRWSAEK